MELKVKEVFKEELLFIRKDRTREFVIRAFELLVPDYFWSVPASSTGKYHPSFALGDGGVVRHTKSAIRIGVELLNNNTTCGDYSDDEKDIAVGALMMHDGRKSGFPKTEFTVFNHPAQMAKGILESEELKKEFVDIWDDIVIEIVRAIYTHMGEWCIDYKTNDRLPKPQSKVQKFVHMCDYLASRKCLEHNFEANVSRK